MGHMSVMIGQEVKKTVLNANNNMPINHILHIWIAKSTFKIEVKTFQCFVVYVKGCVQFKVLFIS